MVPLESPTATRRLTVALIGNPNTGKSTLFSALAGLHTRVGNFPGVTVEKKVGRMRCGEQTIHLVDLPGTYSLSPRSPDEMVSVDVLLGRMPDLDPLDAVVCIVDAANLERNLYLVSQVLDLGLPTVLVLNMWDVAQARGLHIDVDELQRRLGIPVLVSEAHRKRGLEAIRTAIQHAASSTQGRAFRPFPEPFYEQCSRLRETLASYGADDLPEYLIERLLLDRDGQVERELVRRYPALREELESIREHLRAAGMPVPAVEPKVRYGWARELLTGVLTHPETPGVTFSDRIDHVLTHRWFGLLAFAALMFVIFQAIYSWAQPLMDLVESGQEAVAAILTGLLPPGPLRSLCVDGVVAGVGAVLVFLPQIALLFLFIAVLEDCGYMARAAFLMDRLLTRVGLSGKSFVPLMSSFACAVPGVMATRVIEHRADRMVTILVAPLMSCSARLPVYLLLIAAFVPATSYLGGWITLQGLVLFAMTSLGALIAIPVAWTLKKVFFRGETPPFVMELPSYKWPSPRIVAHRVYDRVKAFVVRAGTLIFSATIVVWAAGYFPADHRALDEIDARLESADASADSAAIQQLYEERNRLAAESVAQSYLGRLGHALEPLVRPMGWDWRIGVGVVASFPAREVIIATLGTIYSLGGDVAEDEPDPGLIGAIRKATWPDGTPVYSLPVALSIMVFFALCAQCASTLMVIRRETNSWRWPLFTFAYMTTLAYVGALLTYQTARLFG